MNNKHIIWIVIAIAILIVILVVSGRSSNDSTPSVSPTTTASAITSASSTSKPGSTIAPSIVSYQDALKKYAGTRIQFDARCQAMPSQITIKQGSAIMLDNRSPDARTISVGSVKYSLVGYGFRIVTPTSKTLPSTLLIDCGSAQNVGQVILQK